jgi:ADP-ribose pyrophosphatase
MSGKDLAERTLSSERVYDGVLLRVKRDEVRLPDGGTAVREYVEHPGAAMVIAVLDSGELLLERQYRYPLRRDMIELPAGKIDPGEPPLETAKRELQEETGYTASEWRHAATIHLAIGYSDERIEIFVARGLKHEGAKLDDEEFLEVLHVPLTTAIEWVREGKITDAKSVSGLFWAEKLLTGTWPAQKR